MTGGKLRFWRMAALTLGTCALAAAAWAGPVAEDFGRNRPFDAPGEWRSVSSAHFRVMFPSDSGALASRALELAEEAAAEIGGRLGIAVERESTWVLFPSPRARRRSNVPADDFQEGIRAWSPLLRHRYVLTFEGSWPELEKDIRHGVTHVLQEQTLYPSGAWSVVGVQPFFHAPDWLLEGMALYFAGSAAPSDEVILRGASLANRLLSLEELSDFNDVPDLSLAYMEGLSATAFLVSEYGESVLGSLLRQLSQGTTRDLNDALETSLNVDLKALNKQWQRSVKKRYWPMLRDKQAPASVARELVSGGHAALSDPTWSPSGEVLACIARTASGDRVWLVSAEDGDRLRDATRDVHGRYESIRTGGRALAWSQDGNRVMFLARDGGGLRLFVVDVVTGEALEAMRLPFDDGFSPAFARQGEAIVLVGVRAGQADLYRYVSGARAWSQLTDDAHLDDGPTVSPDGESLLYVSERSGETRLVQLELASGAGRVLLDGAGGVHAPAWGPSRGTIYFTADWSGTRDIYRLDVAGGTVRRLTNLLAGVETPAVSPDGTEVAFSALHDLSEKLYVLPMSGIVLVDVETPDDGGMVDAPMLASGSTAFEARAAPSAFLLDDLGFFIGTPEDGIPRVGMTALASTWTGDTRLALDVRPGSRGLPTTRLRLDWVKPRWDLSARFGQRTVFHRDTMEAGVVSSSLIGEREVQGAVGLSYPISVSRRATFEMSVTRAPFDHRYDFLPDRPEPGTAQTAVAGRIALVQDRVLWSPDQGPVSGVRYRLDVTGTVGQSDLRALSLSFDARRYFRLGSRTVFATRLMFAGSNGGTPERFYLGGHTSLRAAEYESVHGSRVGLASAELRVPLVNEIRLAWPVRVALRSIRGVLFADTGIAWDKGTSPVVGRDTEQGFELVDVLQQYGLGLRARIIGVRLRWDLARGYDLVRVTEWRSLVRVDHDF